MTTDYQLIIFEGEAGIDRLNDNVDVEVVFGDGSRWGATFFTLANIQALFDKNRQTGECHNGLYLWASGMIIVQQCDREKITATIEGLLEAVEFEGAFERLEG
jgi:hypothetical protein